MRREIDRIRGHVILCGFGQVGEAICEEMTRSGRQVVIVDRSLPDRVDGSSEIPMVQGDATDDGVLQRAGLERARTLVLALGSDVDNLFVALTARLANPGIFIVARANHEATIGKLRQAGADRVVNPNQIGGAHMAALVAQPDVVDFLDVVMRDGEFEVRMAHFRDRFGLAARRLRCGRSRYLAPDRDHHPGHPARRDVHHHLGWADGAQSRGHRHRARHRGPPGPTSSPRSRDIAHRSDHSPGGYQQDRLGGAVAVGEGSGRLVPVCGGP